MKNPSKNTSEETERKKRRIEGLPYNSDIIELGIQLELTPYERFLLLVLRGSIHEENKICWKTELTLAKEMGCSRSTISRVLKRLRGKDIIAIDKKRKRMGFENNIYSFNFPWVNYIPATQAGASKSDKDLRPDDTDICIQENQEYASERHFNRIKGNRIKKKEQRQQINEEEDQQPFLKDKKQSASIHEDEIILDRFYPKKIPPAIDLMTFYNGGKVDLEEYLIPFRGQRGELIEKYGHDYSKPLEIFFEEQIKEFYETVIRLHWNTNANEKPGKGFEKTFARACRAGVMYRCGFHPRSREQIMAEKEEDARSETERLKQDQGKERREREKEEDKDLIRKIEGYPDLLKYLYLSGGYPGEVKIEPYLKTIKDKLCELQKKYPGENMAISCKKENQIIESDFNG